MGNRERSAGFSSTAHDSDATTRAVPAAVTPAAHAPGLDRAEVLAREKDSFGGVKIGSAFFGWLTAVGTAVLLTGLASAAGAAVSLATNTDLENAVAQAGDAQTVGLISGALLLGILFLSYYCGGYVAGRMARFHGARQGIAVWLWAVVMTIAVAVVGTLAGSAYDVLARVDLPSLPINEADLTTGGLIALLALTVASLTGAVLGGLAGMRFHRRVDKAGLG